ncbi:hypothetical protein PILCRDRAFT_819116 [Piloderma croceum F 1598]|uniref:Uncharacterized protein n=1 Tax=Piloderma croceum (strain F 1598) TaxID=765440 RepID=A0A0C3BB21_PILCF|nr:hypothetical protein PILCRDRAFT_819116 [Piloderma croceum F 1598]
MRSEQEKKEGLNFGNIPRTSSQGELSLPGTPVTLEHRSSRADQPVGIAAENFWHHHEFIC